ncbi:hypothetical protein KSS87_015216, partial [Heliosperma pusillum]
MKEDSHKDLQCKQWVIKQGRLIQAKTRAQDKTQTQDKTQHPDNNTIQDNNMTSYDNVLFSPSHNHF